MWSLPPGKTLGQGSSKHFGPSFRLRIASVTRPHPADPLVAGTAPRRVLPRVGAVTAVCRFSQRPVPAFSYRRLDVPLQASLPPSRHLLTAAQDIFLIDQCFSQIQFASTQQIRTLLWVARFHIT
jgi:hypothetical protein